MVKFNRIRGDRTRVLLHPGEFYVTNNDMILETVLGSCIAICLKDVKNGVAGMNHFLLPKKPHDNDYQLSQSGRYGINATELLINRMMHYGASRTHLQAKIFGGSVVLAGAKEEGSIGQANVRFARWYLKNEGIPIVAENVGGLVGRKIHYVTSEWTVWVHRLGSQLSEIRREENQFRKQVVNHLDDSDVTLFDDD